MTNTTFTPATVFRTKVNDIGLDGPIYVYAETYKQCDEMADVFPFRDNTQKRPIIIDSFAKADWANDVLAYSLQMVRARGYDK